MNLQIITTFPWPSFVFILGILVSGLIFSNQDILDDECKKLTIKASTKNAPEKSSQNFATTHNNGKSVLGNEDSRANHKES